MKSELLKDTSGVSSIPEDRSSEQIQRSDYFDELQEAGPLKQLVRQIISLWLTIKTRTAPQNIVVAFSELCLTTAGVVVEHGVITPDVQGKGLATLNNSELSILTIALGRLKEIGLDSEHDPHELEVCVLALDKIAQHITQEEINLLDFEPEELSGIAHSFSNSINQPACEEAISKIANNLGQHSGNLDRYRPKHLANLANSFSNGRDNPACTAAIMHIANHVRRWPNGLVGFKSQELASLVNVFSKYLGNPACLDAISKIANRIRLRPDGLESFKPGCLTKLTNGFSSCLIEPACLDAINKIANRIIRLDGLENFDSECLANLANSFSKCLEHTSCLGAIIKIAEHIREHEENLEYFEPEHLAKLANGFSECIAIPVCCAAINKIAQHIRLRSDGLKGFKTQTLANLANSLSKFIDQPACQGVIRMISLHVAAAQSCELVKFKGTDLRKLKESFSEHIRITGDQTCEPAIRIIDGYQKHDSDYLFSQGIGNMMAAIDSSCLYYGDNSNEDGHTFLTGDRTPNFPQLGGIEGNVRYARIFHIPRSPTF